MLPYKKEIIYNNSHLPEIKRNNRPITLNFSLLEDYFECPYRFKLSTIYGFKQPFTELMGYGNILHEIVRNINFALIEGKPITEKFIKETFDKIFYLPYATPKQKERMLLSAKRAIDKYVKNADKFGNIRCAESPVEIDIGDGVTVNGRIDMVKEITVDGQKKTVIVDFKTANKRVAEAINTEQLKIYALGYQRLDKKIKKCYNN